jgi:hypothetical protein
MFPITINIYTDTLQGTTDRVAKSRRFSTIEYNSPPSTVKSPRGTDGPPTTTPHPDRWKRELNRANERKIQTATILSSHTTYQGNRGDFFIPDQPLTRAFSFFSAVVHVTREPCSFAIRQGTRYFDEWLCNAMDRHSPLNAGTDTVPRVTVSV